MTVNMASPDEDGLAGLEDRRRGIGIDIQRRIAGDLPGVQDRFKVVAAVVLFARGDEDDTSRAILQDG